MSLMSSVPSLSHIPSCDWPEKEICSNVFPKSLKPGYSSGVKLLGLKGRRNVDDLRLSWFRSGDIPL